MNYSELQLSPDLAKGIAEAGYIECMPVQEAVFPSAFAGEDIYAQSQTGTGKTAAFLVSIFQRIMGTPECRTRKALILAPTRELAVQIEEEAEKLGKYLPIKCGCFYGGVSYSNQLSLLEHNVQILIGTPGRIIDLVQQGKMLLADVGFLVVDEADRMFDMGFIDDLRKLLRYLPKSGKRQTFLFSATLNFHIKNLAWEYMSNPKEVMIEPEKVTVDLVTQELYHVGSDEKFKILLGLLKREAGKSAIIFCNQKNTSEEVAKRLQVNGYNCEFIMGDLPQSKRLKIIEDLKERKISLLVATDVAARGLDINDLELVINYDLPMEAESYVHRIGRTARAGASGKAISLACEKFVYSLPDIEKYIEVKIPVMSISDELIAEDKSEGMHFGKRYGANKYPARGNRNTRNQRYSSNKSNVNKSRNTNNQSNSQASKNQNRISKVPDKQRTRKTKKMQSNPYAMTSEERMQFYRDKYAGNMKTQKTTVEKNVSSSSNSSKTKKPGLIERIKNFFTKKK